MKASSLKKLIKKLNFSEWNIRKDKTGSRRFKHAYAVFLFIVLVVIGTALAPEDITFQYSEYKVDTRAKENIIAPEMISIIKFPEELKQERQEARDNVLARFYRDRDTEQ